MNDEDLEGLTLKLSQAADPAVRQQIWEELYSRFRRMARNKLNKVGRAEEHSGDVVHELYPGLDRAMANPEKEFENRYSFLGYVSTSMRNHVIRSAQRAMVLELKDDSVTVENGSTELTVTLNRHMGRLRAEYPRAMQAFELRYFGGCSHDEIMAQMPAYRTKALLSSDLGAMRKLLAESIDRE